MEKTNEKIVNETLCLLENKEYDSWEEIYEGYAKKILENINYYMEAGKKLKLKSPLFLYTSIGRIMNGISFDVRFSGQSVGTIVKYKSGKLTLTVNENQASYAKNNFYFNNSKCLASVDWNSFQARQFRRFYYGQISTNSCNIKSEEHRIENFLLNEFKKKNKKYKLLSYIQPVKLGGKFFQLVTPLKASSHNPEISMKKKDSNYIGATGGGIDILARVGKNSHYRITVIELKDENNKNEPQNVVMQQALIYATFIVKLLRSDKNKVLWWNIFREKYNEKKDISNKKLDINVVTLMPSKTNDGESNDENISETIKIDKLNTTLYLYSMYYKKDEKGNPKSFSGSFFEYMKDL